MAGIFQGAVNAAREGKDFSISNAARNCLCKRLAIAHKRLLRWSAELVDTVLA
jgi:hypothetical protein